MSVTAKNPILSGFYPDPSICAVGDDYYLVNSSFVYFPGLPLMHSKDLAHWEQIGNVLENADVLHFDNGEVSQGMFAPTIRYYKGTFYVVCTNVCFGGNFVVTAKDPKGPWSEPHYLEGFDGIDPSIMFDDDGRCYFIGTHPNPEGCQYDGDWYIYIQELDIKNFKGIGERKNVWNGAMKGIHWPEGPHLYHIGEYYYILHAEGGTGPEHAVCVARSKTVFGPYENDFCNPIFTHRHLGVRYPVKYVGHADLFQASNGAWYMTMLAVRPINGFTTLGRETFLARVWWENDWPIVNPGVGILTSELVIDLPEWEQEYASIPGIDRSYDFMSMKKLGPEFLTLRKREEDNYTLIEDKGIKLLCRNSLKSKGNVSYLGIRQDCHSFEIRTYLYTDNLFRGSSAGIVLLQNNRYHLRFEVSNGIGYVIMCKNGIDEKLATISVDVTNLIMVIRVSGLKASVLAVKNDKSYLVAKDIDISCLSTEVAGGFVGCTTGIFASKDSELGDSASENSDGEEPYALFRQMAYVRLVAKKENA